MSGGTIVLIGISIAVAALAAVAWLMIRRRSWRALVGGLALCLAAASIATWHYSQRVVPTLGDCAMPTRVGELGSICGVRRPEDLELVSSHNLIIASEERSGGRLMGLRLDDLGAAPFPLWPTTEDSAEPLPSLRIGDPNCPLPEAASFAPQGMSVSDHSNVGGPVREPVRVAVVAHVGTETIQFFDLEDGPRTRLVWRGCIFYPQHTTGNGVALFDDGSLLATNFLPAGAGPESERYRLRGSFGFDTGDVLRWTPEQGWSHIPGTSGAMPNGIVASRDGSTFYFADAGNWRVAVVRRQDPGRDDFRVHVGGAPDNLTLTRSGTVLATVVTLSGDIPGLCAVGGRECRLGWAIWEVDPATRAATQVFAHDGDAIGSATTALEVGDYLFIGSMADDRIGVYKRR